MTDKERYISLRDKIKDLKAEQTKIADRLKDAVANGDAPDGVGVGLTRKQTCPDLNALVSACVLDEGAKAALEAALTVDVRRFFAELDAAVELPRTAYLEIQACFEVKTSTRLDVRK